jgi:hypothetical protein
MAAAPPPPQSPAPLPLPSTSMHKCASALALPRRLASSPETAPSSPTGHSWPPVRARLPHHLRRPLLSPPIKGGSKPASPHTSSCPLPARAQRNRRRSPEHRRKLSPAISFPSAYLSPRSLPGALCEGEQHAHAFLVLGSSSNCACSPDLKPAATVRPAGRSAPSAALFTSISLWLSSRAPS